VRLYTETFGERQNPSIIFCHGFGGSARNFRPQARALQAHFRVTLFDLRGHARSPAPEGAAAYRNSVLLEDLDELLESEALPTILAGLSLGAKLALDYALSNPARVRALILASYPSSGELETRRAWALDFARTIEERGLDAAGAEFVWAEQSRFDAQGARLIRQGLLEHCPQALAHLLREVLASSPSPQTLAPLLRACRIPACVIAGMDDAESREPSRQLATLLGNAELHEIAGAGHVVNLTHSAQFNQILFSFLAQLTALPHSDG
jgi:pimeloyl-ACP methyl ester carboxylesterase